MVFLYSQFSDYGKHSSESLRKGDAARLKAQRGRWTDKPAAKTLPHEAALLAEPGAVGIAIIHCLAAKCEATAIPEIGLGVMFLVCVLGIMVAFQWSPAFMRKTIFRVHTSSILFLISVSILLIGHSMVD
jgi:hypothetical protein